MLVGIVGNQAHSLAELLLDRPRCIRPQPWPIGYAGPNDRALPHPFSGLVIPVSETPRRPQPI